MLSLSAREFGFNASSIRTKIYDILDQLSGQTFFSFIVNVFKNTRFSSIKVLATLGEGTKRKISHKTVSAIYLNCYVNVRVHMLGRHRNQK